MYGYVISAVNGFVGKYWLSDDSPWELIVDDIFERSLELILLLKLFFFPISRTREINIKNQCWKIFAHWPVSSPVCICTFDNHLSGVVVGGGWVQWTRWPRIISLLLIISVHCIQSTCRRPESKPNTNLGNEKSPAWVFYKTNISQRHHNSVVYREENRNMDKKQSIM